VCALLVSSSGDAINSLPAPGPGAGQGKAAYRSAPAPQQHWGSAAGESHLTGKPVNRSLPSSLRSRYPLHELDQTPQVGSNTASVVEPPEPTSAGFDQATSRELPAERSAFQRTYANADGTTTSEFSGTPINHQQADGTWAPIDTALVPVGGAGGGWRNTADSVDVRIAARADTPELVRLQIDAEHAVSYGLAGAAPAVGAASKDGITYREVLPKVDLTLAARAGGVKETLVLRSPEASHSYLFPLYTPGLTASLVDGQVVLTDAGGVRRAVFPAGFMTDSATAGEGPAMSNGVQYHLVSEGGQPALKVTLDSAWLRDEHRVYPVLVDPTVALPVDSSAADSSMYVQGSGSASGSSELRVGAMSGNTASYLKFGGVTNRLQNHKIYGAQLQLVNYDSASCRPRSVSVHPVTAGWTAGTGYSYPGPAVGAALASRSFAHGYIATGQSSSACPAAAELIDLGVAGRDLVQRWVKGTQANNGLSLRASTSDSSAWKRFAGSDTANPPRLFVTHSPYNASYSIPKPVPEPPVLQNQAGKVKVTVTNLSADAWAPGSYYLAYRAYNATTGAAVGQQRSADLTATVARNARVTLDATIKAMPPGSYFLDFTMVRTGGVVFTDHQVPPGRIVLKVIDIPPVLQQLYPPNGYQAPTLSPQLWAQALDIDAPPGLALQYKFEVCPRDTAGNPVNCFNSGYLTSTAWTVPPGKLTWSQTYLWRAYVKDATTETISPYSSVLTDVPQPEIISRIAGAPYGSQDQEFDAQVGNYSTAAMDATVSTVGPELNVIRTYNSLDPRRDSAFGAGWTTRYDMRLVPDDDGSGNVVITYPDGQAVRFGKNPNGTFAAPSGRTAVLTTDSTGWKLADKAGTTYQFSTSGRLSRISDISLRSMVLTYNTADGRLAKAQVVASSTHTAGRALYFTWTGGHVTSVRTDPVNGTALTWNYTYNGDLLTQACAPGAVCTTYTYAAGSHYRSAALDSRPESYWRLGEAQGSGAASEIAVNLGKDAGTYHNVTLGTAGALAGGAGNAASFNGTSSSVELPKGLLKKSRDGAVELWFKGTLTGTGGPLLGYQDKAQGTASTVGVPLLYVGTDGRLRGQFWTGGVSPVASTAAVNDGRWHHVVLSAMSDTQTLYLDGAKVGQLTGKIIDHSLLTFNQIGAAYASTPASWPGWGATAQRYFAGAIDEVALYSRPLGSAAVSAHYRYGTGQADQVNAVTLPSGKIAAQVTYDVGLDRVAEYTDHNGGTWKIGGPTVYGGDDDLRRGVQVLDPADRPHLYEYDALAGRLLRSGLPLGLELRPEDRPAQPTSSPSPPPQEVCSKPDPLDPAFCTTIPGDAGGPVFVSHPLDGMAIRTFSYDDRGFQNVVTNENGDSVTMTFDDRGNVTSRKTCRTSTQCFTSYDKYPATVTNPLDPRGDLPLESRDGRSASATDSTYRTTFGYHSSGQLAAQTNPDGSAVSHTYTNGAEPAIGGGAMPAGLVLASTDARGKITKFGYYANGDLGRVTQPSGLATISAYDVLGRRITETEISDSFPAGVSTSYTYDPLSRLATTTEPATTDSVTGARHQQRTTQSYDADGNLTQVNVQDVLGTDPARSTVWEYDEHNRPERITDAEGNETSYGYDSFGNRTSMVDPAGNRYDYAYTARNMIAEVRLRAWTGDPAGSPPVGDYLVLHSYSYDFAGRMASDTDSMGRRLEYEYYGDDLLRRVVLKKFRNPDGSTRDYVVEENTYDGAGNLTKQVAGNGKAVTQQTLDRVGKVLTSVSDPGGLDRTTTYAYDANGNVLRTTSSGDPANVPWVMPTSVEAVDYAYDDSGNPLRETVSNGVTTQVTRYTYDQRGLLTAETDPRGNVTGADPAAYTSRYSYDELGRQILVTGPNVAAESGGQAPTAVSPIRRFGYNAFDERVAAMDELGQVSRATYDRIGRPTSASEPRYFGPGTISEITPTTTYRYDALGNVIETVDPRGSAIRYGYDQLGRMTTRDEPVTTNSERAIWRYGYTRTGEVLSVTDPTGGRTEATYDDLDRQVTATQVERRPVTDNLTTRYTYDDSGNLTNVVSPTGAASVYAYDAVGELIRSTDPSGVAVLYGYDQAGRQIRLSDGLGRTSRTAYDPLGQVTSESDLKSDGTVLRSQRYRYDLAGNLIASIDPLDVTTSYEYDAFNQLVKQVEPVTASTSIMTSFGYDAAGNRTRYTDGRGNATIFTVNTLGLPESVIEPSTPAHPATTDRTWTVAYDGTGNPTRLAAPGGVIRLKTYDAAGRMSKESGDGATAGTPLRSFGYDPLGQLTAVSAPGGTDTYSYNDRGSLLTVGGPSGSASFGYDGDGNLSSRTDAAGAATFTYRNARLNSVKDGITNTPQTLGYDAAGALSTVDYGSGRVRTYSYDDFGRIASDTLRNAGAQSVGSASYRYDSNDQLIGKTTSGTAGAGDNTYTYDQAGRLASWVSGAGTVGYQWDASGNRTQAGSKAATFDARNRLLTDGDYAYAYTARGTLASKTSSGLTERFDFDAFDRLVSAAGQSYAYDGLDRVASRNGTDFTYAGLDDTVVSDGAERYARGPSNELLAVGAGTKKQLALTDQHGDVVVGFDPANTGLTGLADSTAYDPFGTVTAQAGDTSNLGFQGAWTDPATGQVDMGARWYDPGTGTFDSRDSVDYAEGDSILANRYVYAAGDPLGFTDLDGHWPSCDWCKKVVSKVGGAIKSAASTVYHGVTSAASYVWSGFKTVVSYAWSAIKTAAKAVSSAAKWVYHKAKSAVKYVANKVSAGVRWVAGKVASAAAAAERWAKQKAEQVRRAAVERAKQITRVAKAAVAYAAKHNPLPAIAAALKPITSGLKKLVSAAANLPASVVSTLRDVVADVTKSIDVIYQKAVEAAGSVIENVSRAVDVVVDLAQAAAPYLKAGLRLAADAIGVTDLVNCVTKGDLEACLWTAVTIAGYLAGGVGGGAVRAARAGTLAAKHGDEAIDLVRGGKRLADEAGDLAQSAASCGKRNSFTADTRVRMADGSTKPISEVKIGDRVLATDPTTGRTGGRAVTDVIVGDGEKHLVEITVDTDGAQGDRVDGARTGADGTGAITATDEHPFWVAGEDRWVGAGELRPGQRIASSDGGTATMLATRAWTEQEQVYNLTVDELHTFYVVANGIDLLAHNSNPDCRKHGVAAIFGSNAPCICPRSSNVQRNSGPGALRHPDTPGELDETLKGTREKGEAGLKGFAGPPAKISKGLDALDTGTGAAGLIDGGSVLLVAGAVGVKAVVRAIARRWARGGG
jgi:RHS repeat-associated protein